MTGLLPVAELLHVELLAVLVGDLVLAALPDGHHAVDDLVPDGLDPVLLGLALLVGLPGLDVVLVLHHHVDGPTDVVGVLLDQVPEPVRVQVLGVGAVLVVGPQVHDDVGPPGVLLALPDAVPVRALGGPLPCLVLAVGLRPDGDPVGHQERGVEAHAELADDVHVRGAGLHLLLEVQGAAVRDDPQVGVHVLLGHPDSVVRDRDCAGVLVIGDVDPEVLPGDGDLVGLRDGPVVELVDGVRRVGDDLPQEDLPVGVDRVDHEVEKLLGFRFELFLCHPIAFDCDDTLFSTRAATAILLLELL